MAALLPRLSGLVLGKRFLKVLPSNYLHTFRHLSGRSNSDGSNLSKKHKDDAEVVVIGGGVVGTSITYHLAKQGMKDVVLLEKTELTAGSTWHAAGLTTSYNPAIGPKKIHYYSLMLYSQLEKETGQEINFHRPGSIRLATTPDRIDEFKYVLQKQGWNKAPMWMLTPDEVHKMCPLMKMDDVHGGLFTKGDGHVDPYSLTQALAIGARMYGAEIYMPAPVTDVKQRPDGRWDVTTPHGTINAKRVINAAGFWAREVGLLSGISLPLIPVHHQYVVTATIPDVLALKDEIPVIRDLGGSYYLRKERNGLLFGPYEAVEKIRIQEDWWDGVPPGFGKELYESDMDRIMDNVEMAMHRFPVLKDADIASVVAGPIYYTPDGSPLVGPYPEHHNYWLAAGFGYGIINGGGVGKYLADWIINEEPTYDLIECEPGRFGHWTTREFVIEKSRESYGLSYCQQIYPKEERWAGRPMRTSPIYKHTLGAGAECGFHSGWEVPHWYAKPGDDAGYKPSYYRTNWFEPVGREVELILNKVGITDLSSFAKIDVKGKDAIVFLDKMVANELPSIGAVNVSHMLTYRGRVYAEVTIARVTADHFFIITGGGSEYHDLRWLLDHARDYNDVQITNRTDEQACISIAGPLSRDMLNKLTSDDITNKGFKFMNCRSMEVAGIPVLALRVSYTGELGWEFYVKNDNAVQLYEAILQAGQEFGIDHFGSYAVNSLRLEKGFRLWGHEMNMDTNPYEAGLDFFIKLKKEANFIGKDALLQKKGELLEKHLVCMVVDTDKIDAEGDETIWLNNKVVGSTTSGSYGYQVKKSIAYAYLPMYMQDVGTEVEIEMMDKRYKATVVQEPLVHMEATRTRMAARQKK